MFRKQALVLAAAVVSLVFTSQVMAQDTTPAPGPGGAPGAGGPGGGGRGGRGGNFDPAAMRQQMNDRLKTELGATDDEWKVLQPKVEKVMTLSMELRGGGMGMGGRRGGPGGAPAAPAADAPDIQKKRADLQTVLDNKDSSPDAVKTALAAYRDARAKAKADLEAAQKDLQSVLKARQEAQLVLRGMLD